MISKTMIVMLIWIGFEGGPATLTGFSTIEACEQEIPMIIESYRKIKQRGEWDLHSGLDKAICISVPLDKKEEK